MQTIDLVELLYQTGGEFNERLRHGADHCDETAAQFSDDPGRRTAALPCN